MPKLHNIGPKHFVQYTRFPYEWGNKVITRGWTQELEFPYRTSKPFILRLPKYKALVFGYWSSSTTEEKALTLATSAREATIEDFDEDKGWIPTTVESGEESIEDFLSRLDGMDGTSAFYYWQKHFKMGEGEES